MKQLSELEITAELYAREIFALESLFEIEQRSQIENPDENDLIAEALKTLCQELPFKSATESFFLWLNNTALALEVFRNENQSSAIIEILRACGGDRCEFVRDTRDGEQLIMNFSSDGKLLTQRLWVRHLCEVLDRSYLS